MTDATFWDERYAREGSLFGTEPNRFLHSQRARLRPGTRALALADGEGRNGVWLAEQGLDVVAVDSSSVALNKARALAQARGVAVTFECADLRTWSWPENAFDAVVAIFIQFADSAERARLHAHIVRTLAPGGVLILQGYTPRQLEYRTGGPGDPDRLYTAEQLRREFAALEVLHAREHDSEIREGSAHCGMSALVEFVAVKRAAGGRTHP